MAQPAGREAIDCMVGCMKGGSKPRVRRRSLLAVLYAMVYQPGVCRLKDLFTVFARKGDCEVSATAVLGQARDGLLQ